MFRVMKVLRGGAGARVSGTYRVTIKIETYAEEKVARRPKTILVRAIIVLDPIRVQVYKFKSR